MGLQTPRPSAARAVRKLRSVPRSPGGLRHLAFAGPRRGPRPSKNHLDILVRCRSHTPPEARRHAHVITLTRVKAVHVTLRA